MAMMEGFIQFIGETIIGENPDNFDAAAFGEKLVAMSFSDEATVDQFSSVYQVRHAIKLTMLKPTLVNYG